MTTRLWNSLVRSPPSGESHSWSTTHFQNATPTPATDTIPSSCKAPEIYSERGGNPDKSDFTYAFHLEREGTRGPYLRMLADRACLVITEEMPVAPLRQWAEQAARRSESAWYAVDTACIVPMRLVGKAHTRAFAYRKATQKMYAQRLEQPPVQAANRPAHASIALPFEPLDLETADLPSLLQTCEIDHSIGPVPDTEGGSQAGYARWNRFAEDSLHRYAKRRNDALVDGVSCMSAYLHYGMVSPMQLARDCAALDHDGAQKYLDELLIWRELAYAFCFYRRDHGRIDALPSWATETLEKHGADERPHLHSWEVLSRGKTGDPLWDAAQQSLLLHGELHNNVRMTWGKAILQWTPDAKRALKTIIDLNHRYALDGRDPASYGGILWCLGQFDRPFHPERPILGLVRERTTEGHAKRLDPQSFARKVHSLSHAGSPKPRVAIVGAGISGLVCARTLADQGYPVTVWEKSRGVGGRMATRREQIGPNTEIFFDHGAQYFTVRDDRFRRYVDSWRHTGLVQPWSGKAVALRAGKIESKIEKQSGKPRASRDRFVAIPGMNAIGKHLAAGLDVNLQTTIGELQREGDAWILKGRDAADAEMLHHCDLAVVATPAQQAAALLKDAPHLAEQASVSTMNGCWALMLSFQESLELGFSSALVHDSPLAWIAQNSSKPSRDASPENWVLHATPSWSNTHIDAEPEFAREALLAAFWQAVGSPPHDPLLAKAHRWRYAMPASESSSPCLFDACAQVVACGDWCVGPRVEAAFLSGMAAAGCVMRQWSEQATASLRA